NRFRVVMVIQVAHKLRFGEAMPFCKEVNQALFVVETAQRSVDFRPIAGGEQGGFGESGPFHEGAQRLRYGSFAKREAFPDLHRCGMMIQSNNDEMHEKASCRAVSARPSRIRARIWVLAASLESAARRRPESRIWL